MIEYYHSDKHEGWKYYCNLKRKSGLESVCASWSRKVDEQEKNKAKPFAG